MDPLLVAAVFVAVEVVGVYLILTGLARSSPDASHDRSGRAIVVFGKFQVKGPQELIYVVVGGVMVLVGLSFGAANIRPAGSEVVSGPTPTTTTTDIAPPASESTSTVPPSTTTSPPSTTSPSTVAPPSAPVQDIVAAAAGGGEAFVFKNPGGVLADDYVDQADCHRDERRFGLRLIWDMSAPGDPSAGWGVQWESHSPGGYDASSFRTLRIAVRGHVGGEDFQVGLKDLDGHEVKVESRERLVVSATDWSELVIALEEFTGVQTSRLANVNIGFNSNHSSGQICIDEISFA